MGCLHKSSMLRFSSLRQYLAQQRCTCATQASRPCPEPLRASVVFRETGASHQFVRRSMSAFHNLVLMEVHVATRLAPISVCAEKASVVSAVRQTSTNACQNPAKTWGRVRTSQAPSCATVHKVSKDKSVRKSRMAVNQVHVSMEPFAMDTDAITSACAKMDFLGNNVRCWRIPAY